MERKSGSFYLLQSQTTYMYSMSGMAGHKYSGNHICLLDRYLVFGFDFQIFLSADIPLTHRSERQAVDIREKPKSQRL